MTDRIKKVKFFGDSRLSSPESLQAYASDGSIYRIDPKEVFCPLSAEEAQKAVRQALKDNLPVTPRGGGTGLAGGALGTGLIIDTARLTEIFEINVENKYVECQPGIIYRDLNFILKDYGLFFPPDPSSGDSCLIGGMLANNSSGPRSVKYGITCDYVEELTLLNQSGNIIELKKFRLGSDELEAFFNYHSEYRDVFDIINDNRDLILSRWPKLRKNSAGYNLHRVASDIAKGIFNLPALYVGSEGTLGIFLKVKLRLLPLPDAPLSFRLFFNSLEEAGAAVAPLLASGPSALEIVDGSTLDLIGREKHKLPPDAQAMLLLEYDNDHESKLARLEKLSHEINLARLPERARDESERADLWSARRAIVPILYRHDAVKRPFAFIEDASVPVEKLTEFIAWIRQRLEKENLIFGLFGHIGDGNLHIRPLLDINNDADFALTKRLYDEVYAKIFEIGGASTAEHADGRLRAPVLKKLYGEEIYEIHCRIKNTLDPKNLLNPDVVLSERQFADGIDYDKLILTCAACGKCNGYCPAYEVFRREDMSARGWLRMMHVGNPDEKALLDTYQYCLNCKNCTTVCPAGVDIAGEILAFKAGFPHRMAGRIISVFDRRGLFKSALKLNSLANPVAASAAGRRVTALAGKSTFGFDREVQLPLPSFKTLRDRHKDLINKNGKVAFFHGCADNYFISNAGDALIKAYQHYGIDVSLPDQHCCGLPMEVYGHRENLVEKAKFNIDRLEPFEAVVFTCASCLHRLADYHELLAGDSEYHEKALALKDKLFDACQFLLDADINLPERSNGSKLKLSYHHPCHLRAAKLENKPLELMSKINDIEMLHPDRAGRCCGQAGSFGFTHYQEGKEIFAAKKVEYDKLKPEVIVSSCPSCISKLRKELGPAIRICHPMEVIADLIEGKDLHASK